MMRRVAAFSFPILLCLAWSLSTSIVHATTYYVRTSGSDANAGTTPAGAFLKIKKAVDTAVAGDTIYVGAGSYNTDDITPNNNGTAGSIIRCIADTTGAYTGDAGAVTISGKKWNHGNKAYWTIDGFTITGDTSVPSFRCWCSNYSIGAFLFVIA